MKQFSIEGERKKCVLCQQFKLRNKPFFSLFFLLPLLLSPQCDAIRVTLLCPVTTLPGRVTCLFIMQAIEFLHSIKLIHTDLKPENILMRGWEERVVTLDSGTIRVPASPHIKGESDRWREATWITVV